MTNVEGGEKLIKILDKLHENSLARVRFIAKQSVNQ